MQQQRSNIRISGSGKVAGGLYDEIRISGSGHVEGSCDAVSVHVSGSARFTDSVKVSNDLHCSGSCRIEGNADADEFHISGSFKAEAVTGGVLHSSGNVNARDIDVREMHISGSAASDHAIHAQRIQCSGKLTANEGVEAEEARISGMVDMRGLLNVNDLLIEMSTRSVSRADEVGGDRIVVRPAPHTAWFSGLFGMGKPAFSAKVIEGNDVELSYTDADIVRGARVRINEGCHIKRVEYTESLYVDPAALVDERQEG